MKDMSDPIIAGVGCLSQRRSRGQGGQETDSSHPPIDEEAGRNGVLGG